MDAAPCLVHVGYHKTASTYLQRELFFAPDSRISCPLSARETMDLIVTPLRWEFDAGALRALIDERVQALPSGTVPVISQERLSGHFVTGGEDAAELADRMAAVVPGGRVLMVVREQRAMILSSYNEYVRDGGTATLKTFLDPPGGRYNVLPWFRFTYCEYDRLIEHYHSLFGSDRVLVLAMESLAQDPQSFLGKVAAFCGSPEPRPPDPKPARPSRHGLALAIERWANRLFATTKLNPGPILPLPQGYLRTRRLAAHAERWLPAALARPIDRRMRAVVDTAIDGRYKASNHRTASLTGLDLEALGYQW